MHALYLEDGDAHIWIGYAFDFVTNAYMHTSISVMYLNLEWKQVHKGTCNELLRFAAFFNKITRRQTTIERWEVERRVSRYVVTIIAEERGFVGKVICMSNGKE